MNVVCLDMEGVLYPEIWIAFSEESGIPELRRTTRQIFSSGFDMCVERLRPGNWVFIPYVYLILHFGSLYDVSSVTSVMRMPGFSICWFSRIHSRNVPG